MSQNPSKKYFVTLFVLLILCYALMYLSIKNHRQRQIDEFQPLESGHLTWRLENAESLVSEILRPIIENNTWQGRPFLASLTNPLWFTAPADLELLAKSLTTGGLNISSLAEYSTNALVSDELTLQLLSDPPLLDHLEAVNESTSRVVILGSQKEYSVSDAVKVRLDVYNGYGKALTRGSDQIRVWAVDTVQQASLATDVTDLGNGSYLATLPLLWPGDVQIKAAITFNREVLRAISFVKTAVRTTKFMAAGFFTDFGNAATLCSTSPFVPGGYAQVCDLSSTNGDMPWFCGRPHNSAISCHHWTHVADLPFVNTLPVTEAEQYWLSWLDTPKNLRVVQQYAFQHEQDKVVGGVAKIKVNPVPLSPKTELKPACSERSMEASWVDTAPRGFWFKQIWNPTACAAPIFGPTQVSACLANTTVLLLGDSNLRLALAVLKDLTGCTLDTGGKVKPKWHRPMRCVKKETKTEIRWHTHAQPFHTGKQEWSERTNQKAVSEYIDEIPTKGKFIVIVHLYLHYTTELIELYRTHMRAVRAAVERLLNRNPQAKVVIRAPHAASQFWPTIHGTDSFAWAFTEVTKAEFVGLYDKVLFVQPWDMTVAVENVVNHPPNYVNKAIMNNILSHLC